VDETPYARADRSAHETGLAMAGSRCKAIAHLKGRQPPEAVSVIGNRVAVHITSRGPGAAARVWPKELRASVEHCFGGMTGAPQWFKRKKRSADSGAPQLIRKADFLWIAVDRCRRSSVETPAPEPKDPTTSCRRPGRQPCTNCKCRIRCRCQECWHTGR
jgi:hypothetical protein